MTTDAGSTASTPQRGLLSKKMSSTAQRNCPVRIVPLHQEGLERDWEGTTAAERVAAMWQLKLDAWP
jgi:hypothetical protein